uniref:Uncharacterized protein n=1 Tax=Arundo donax TaxID=35708 RepID=A0A0A9BF63_ARUDO
MLSGFFWHSVNLLICLLSIKLC